MEPSPAPIPSSGHTPSLLALRRCASVEVLLEENGTEAEEREEGGATASRTSSTLGTPSVTYSRSQSLQALNLATPTPTTPSTVFSYVHGSRGGNAVVADSTQTPPSFTYAEVGRHNLTTLHEEHVHGTSRISSRRSSVSSIVNLVDYPHEEEGNDGFEVIHPGSEVRLRSEVKLMQLQSTESTASFVYMENHYSWEGGMPPSGVNGEQPLTEVRVGEEAEEKEEEVGGQRERRRSSVAEIVLPIAAIAAHMIPIALQYLGQ